MGARDEHRLAQLLREAGPAPLEAATAQDVYERAWEAIRAGMADVNGAAGAARTARVAARRLDVIAAADARARRRRRVTRTSAIATAVLLAGVGTAAADSFVATHTGQHSTGWQVQASGPGEWLNMGGDDYVEVIRKLIADIPFAPGYEHLREAEPVTGSLRGNPDRSKETEEISESAARAQAADDAICTWADAWVAADTSGDRAARDAATTALAGSLHWPAVRTLDPDPSPTGYVGDSGVGSPTRFGRVPALITAAQGGQRQAVLDAAAGDGCFPDYAPVINADPDYAGGPGH